MARPNTASTVRNPDHEATLHAAHDAGHAPANQVEAASQPLKPYVLDAARRAHYLAMALALDAANVPAKLPAHVQAHLDWMAAIQGTAWYDRAELARAAIDGSPVTEADVDDLGFRVAFVREVIARAAVPPGASSTHPSQLGEGALKAEIVRCQSVLCDALVARCNAAAARGEDVAAVRKVLRSVRRGRAAARLAAGCVSLFALCDDATVAWLRALPKREGAAYDRLRALHPEWDRRMKHTGSAPAHDGTASDLPQRAYALACEPVGRIVNTGRYLIRGRAERTGDYPGYRRPKARKAAAPAQVTPTATPPATPPQPA